MYKFISPASSAVVHIPTSRCVYLDQPSNIHTEIYLNWVAEGGVTDPYVAPPTPEPQPPEQVDAQRIAALWQAANKYETDQISGSATASLVLGVMQGKPKCIAVKDWIKGIWSAYYERKANGSTDYSFVMAGACPHTVPELMQELGL